MFANRDYLHTSIPAGALGLLLCLFTFPDRFPNHYKESNEANEKGRFPGLDLGMLQKIDIIGATLLLGASVLLVTALQEGDVHFAWESAAIICFFVISGLLWVAFIAWQWYVSHQVTRVEPMFPWRFFRNRTWMGTLL